MLKFKKVISLVLAVSMFTAMGTTVSAVENTNEVGTDNFIIYIDANGNEVFHRTPTNGSVDKAAIKIIDETKEVRKALRENTSLDFRANHYDTEDDPVFIGNWGTDAYARHTLGTQYTENEKPFLKSQGDATWYNSKSLIAVPYRNGNSTVSEHKNQIDVKKGTMIKVTGTSSDKSVTVKINDFGPNQFTSPGSKTIVDLNVKSFETLFGKKSVGRSHCTTEVEVQQYFN